MTDGRDPHESLRRLSARGTTRGADDVLAAARQGVRRRRATVRLAVGGAAVVVLALGIVLSRPSQTANDLEIGPAVDAPTSAAPTDITIEPEPIPERGSIVLTNPVDRDPRCGSSTQLAVPLGPIAQAAAATSLEGWLNTIPRSDAAPFVEDWDGIGEAVLAAAEAAPLPLDDYRGELGDVVFWGANDLVCFEYSILNGDTAVYSAVGAVIRSDDTWLVSRHTVCAALAVGPIACPAAAAATGPAGCSALYGNEPWVVLFELARYPECYRVASFQRIRVFNKGNVSVFLDWPEGELNLGVDEFHDAAPAGDILEFGENTFASDSVSSPTLWLIAEDESPLFGFSVDGDTFGPIRVGMTIDEANAVAPDSFPDLRVDTGLLPGPDLWGAVFQHDPYSPIFEVSGTGDEVSVIVRMIAVGGD